MEYLEAIFIDGLKKFGGEIIAAVLFAVVLWSFPKFRKFVRGERKSELDEERIKAEAERLAKELLQSELQKRQELNQQEQKEEHGQSEAQKQTKAPLPLVNLIKSAFAYLLGIAPVILIVIAEYFIAWRGGLFIFSGELYDLVCFMITKSAPRFVTLALTFIASVIACLGILFLLKKLFQILKAMIESSRYSSLNAKLLFCLKLLMLLPFTAYWLILFIIIGIILVIVAIIFGIGGWLQERGIIRGKWSTERFDDWSNRLENLLGWFNPF